MSRTADARLALSEKARRKRSGTKRLLAQLSTNKINKLKKNKNKLKKNKNKLKKTTVNIII